MILDGAWDFHIEGGAPRKLNVPGVGRSGRHRRHAQRPHPAWSLTTQRFYSRTFDLPDALRGKDLVLLMGPVDDFDWTSLNGHQSATPARTPPPGTPSSAATSSPPPDLKPTGNLLEVKVYDRGGEGGIIGFRLLMTAEQEKQWRTMPLHLNSATLRLRPDAAIVTLHYEVKGWTVAEEWRVSLVRPFASRRVDLTVADASAGTPTFDNVRLNLGSLDSALSPGHISAAYTWPPLTVTVAISPAPAASASTATARLRA